MAMMPPGYQLREEIQLIVFIAFLKLTPGSSGGQWDLPER
jgi:hypothetical protein